MGVWVKILKFAGILFINWKLQVNKLYQIILLYTSTICVIFLICYKQSKISGKTTSSTYMFMHWLIFQVYALNIIFWRVICFQTKTSFFYLCILKLTCGPFFSKKLFESDIILLDVLQYSEYISVRVSVMNFGSLAFVLEIGIHNKSTAVC